MISIHVPQVGHDRPVFANKDANLQISIHVPQVGHDEITSVKCFKFDISIHVPQVGHDAYLQDRYTTVYHFNPRAPGGARPAQLPFIEHFCISIHVPQVGHDYGRFWKKRGF